MTMTSLIERCKAYRRKYKGSGLFEAKLVINAEDDLLRIYDRFGEKAIFFLLKSLFQHSENK